MQRWDHTKLSFEGHEMQTQNIPADRTQREDEKMGSFVRIICHFGVMAIKMSKMAHKNC